MLQHGNVADDPSYLSDIAAAIADCETHEYQEILEETNVCIMHKCLCLKTLSITLINFELFSLIIRHDKTSNISLKIILYREILL